MIIELWGEIDKLAIVDALILVKYIRIIDEYNLPPMLSN